MAFFTLLVVALASDVTDPLDYRPGSFNVRDTPLQQILERSAVVVEGELVEVRDDVWLGPEGAYTRLIWRIRVEEEMVGHVQSGYVDLSVEDWWPPRLKPGERILVMAGPQTLYAPVSENQIDAISGYPAYDDLLVPTAYGSMYFTMRLLHLEDVSTEWGSTRSQDDVSWLERDEPVERWSELLDIVRAASALCSSCGFEVAGATVGGAP